MFLNHKVFQASLLLLSLILASCGKIPSDPDNTFDQAKGTALVVGFVPSPPWVAEQDGSAGGIEGELISRFAMQNGMKIKWEVGSEQELMNKLIKKELHVLIAGLTRDNPWKSEKIGITRAYFVSREPDGKKKKHVIAVLQGENKLVKHLEKHLYENRDLINRLVNEKSKEF